MKNKNIIIIDLVENFFNMLCEEIDSTYFPHVKYYGDDKNCSDIHYAVECFSNGVIDYNTLIRLVSIKTNETKNNIHNIVSKYVSSFNDFKYNEKSN
jgi:hypothetical protein